VLQATAPGADGAAKLAKALDELEAALLATIEWQINEAPPAVQPILKGLGPDVWETEQQKATVILRSRLWPVFRAVPLLFSARSRSTLRDIARSRRKWPDIGAPGGR
jgi:hypothetical protein